MHPDVEPFARAYSEKQKAFWEAQRQLDESTPRFLAADPSAASYYAISQKHTEIFRQWIAALQAVEDAADELNDRAIEAANLPPDHPLRSRQRRKRD